MAFLDMECTWTKDDQDACPYCSGEACAKCGPYYHGRPDCECDIVERHSYSSPMKKDPVDREPCGVFAPRHSGMPTDENGCVLEDGHAGPHMYEDEFGGFVTWIADLECGCDSCFSSEPDDWCVIWSRKRD